MPFAVPLLILQQAAGASPPAADSAALRHADGRSPRVVVASRTTAAPRIDGRLEDPAWALGHPVGGFTQITPDEGRPASESTLVRIVYDDDAIYVGARLFDAEPHRIERRLGRRDGFLDSDMFFVNFDSYHDHRTAFEFAVSPTGVRQDDITSNDFFFGDRSWDPVWDVATSIDSLGWVAEMRIPFSQLRFPRGDVQVWGVQFFRNVFRKNEQSMLEFVGRTETGYASRFAHLVGIERIPAPRRLEVLPYAVGRVTTASVTDPADPFAESVTGFAGVGVDAKYGLTSGLTLDATVNPDFGQVEADPAIVNLSAFEVQLDERRPFFVEGASIFEFGQSAGEIRFGGTPQYFYSRRIGAPPSATDSAYARASYLDVPNATTILGAGKITGKSGGGWSLGVLDAVTAREWADVVVVDSLGQPASRRMEVEPLTNYFVGRLRREWRGTTGFGLLGTAVHRDLRDPDHRYLRSQAYVLAADFFHRWQRNTYSLSATLGGALVRGDTAAIGRTQRASSRYFQRPDQDRVRYDSSRTTLAGLSADFQVSKDGGATNWALAASTTTPGFEVNDLGFQTRVDRVSAAAFLGHRWTRPGRVLRQASVSLSGGPSWNYDEDLIGARVSAFHFGQFLNYWGYNLQLGYGFRTLNDRLTRGGPLTADPAEVNVGGGLFSDGRKRVTLQLFGFYERSTAGGWFAGAHPSVGVRPTPALELSVSPGINRGHGMAQYVQRQGDPSYATATYGARYVFATIDQSSVDVTLRMNLTMTPRLTLQLYVQPFTFSADYEDYKELTAPRTFDFLIYGRDGASTRRDVASANGDTLFGYVVDPDGGGGPAAPFFVGNQDFVTSSFQSNAVLRWEYRPGSTLFVVWTVGRFAFTPYQDHTDPAGELGDLLLFRSAKPTHTLQVKLNYWLSL
jgi:hypothetical protein